MYCASTRTSTKFNFMIQISTFTSSETEASQLTKPMHWTNSWYDNSKKYRFMIFVPTLSYIPLGLRPPKQH
ncbi:hypothetical protein AHAS_Ahas01G0306000 [Arachis hypogaea]